MHLKSLTLRGFKSFASSTTCASSRASPASSDPTGPASPTSWTPSPGCMGEQGAKSLRGGKMEDVIFAGTAGRPPLGRAEVAAHDRQHRRRPADRLHRGHDLADDVPQRRLGVRHQRHAVPPARRPGAAVGLRHRPRDARHRRPGPARRRAARRLRRSAAGSSRRRRASSSTASARRRRSASSTRCRPTSPGCRTSRPSCAASSSRSASRRRSPAARPSSRPTCATPGCGCSPTTSSPCATPLEQEVADETRPARASGRGRVARCAGAQAREAELEAAIAAEAPTARPRAGDVVPPVRLRERFRGTAALAAERRAPPAPEPDERATLVAIRRSSRPRPREAREEEAELGAEWRRPRGPRRGRHRRAAAEAEPARRGAASGRRSPGRRGPPRGAGPAHGPGRRAAQPSRRRPRSRDRPARPRAPRRRERARTRPRPDFHALEAEVAGLDEGEVGLDERARGGRGRPVVGRGAASQALRLEEREAERERMRWPPASTRSSSASRARTVAPRCWRRATGCPACSARWPRCCRRARVRGGRGGGARRRRPTPSPSASLGATRPPPHPAQVRRRRARRPARRRRRGADDRAAGRRCRPVPGGPSTSSRSPDALRPALLARCSTGVAVVDDLDAAAPALVDGRARRARRDPRRRPAGRRLGGRAGRRRSRSLLEVQAARRRGASARTRADHRCERLRFALRPRDRGGGAVAGDVDDALSAPARVRRADGRRRRAARPARRPRPGRRRRGRAARRGRVAAADDGAATRPGRARRRSRSGSRRQRRAPTDERARLERRERDRLAERRGCARQAEVEARLAVRTGEERVRALARPRRRARARRRRGARPPGSAAARRAASAGARGRRGRSRRAPGAAARSPGSSGRSRWPPASATPPSRPRTVREGELLALRAPSPRAGRRARALTDAVHRDEVARAEQRLRIEALEARGARGVRRRARDPGRGVRPGGRSYRRRRRPPATRSTARRPSRARARTTGPSRRSGCARPSARWRCSARSTRWRWRSSPRSRSGTSSSPTQLEDLKATRRDLLTVVKDVDERVAAGLRRGLRRRRARVRAASSPAVPRRRGPAGAHRPGRHADDRHRGRGAAARQEGQAAVAAVRRRAVADRGGVPGRDLPGPAVAVLRHGRGRGRARRRQPAAGCSTCSTSCASDVAADHHHPPEAHDGDRRRALRRLDARRRRHPVISQRLREDRAEPAPSTASSTSGTPRRLTSRSGLGRPVVALVRRILGVRPRSLLRRGAVVRGSSVAPPASACRLELRRGSAARWSSARRPRGVRDAPTATPPPAGTATAVLEPEASAPTVEAPAAAAPGARDAASRPPAGCVRLRARLAALAAARRQGPARAAVARHARRRHLGRGRGDPARRRRRRRADPGADRLAQAAYPGRVGARTPPTGAAHAARGAARARRPDLDRSLAHPARDGATVPPSCWSSGSTAPARPPPRQARAGAGRRRPQRGARRGRHLPRRRRRPAADLGRAGRARRSCAAPRAPTRRASPSTP